MHSWGSKDSEGRDICHRVDVAADYIGTFLVRWGRIVVIQTKEKFGTARVYCYWGWSSFHGIIWPRHVWIHRWWPYALDMKIWNVIGSCIMWFTAPYRKFIYRLAYKRAIKKWPDLREEILCCADYGEFLEGL